MAMISMTLSVTHTFDAEGIDETDPVAVEAACLEEALELASRTGLDVDTSDIDIN